MSTVVSLLRPEYDPRMFAATFDGAPMMPDGAYNGGTLYVWNGENEPEAGESYPFGFNGFTAARYEMPTHVMIPSTLWGDYVGSSFERSNAQSIARDYPETVITVYDDHSYECLVVPINRALPDGFVTGVLALADEYPIWDENDLSELEVETEAEDWESWGRDQFRMDVMDALPEDKQEIIEDATDNRLAELFDVAREFTDNYGEYRMDTAVSGRWGDWDNMVAYIVTAITEGTV